MKNKFLSIVNIISRIDFDMKNNYNKFRQIQDKLSFKINSQEIKEEKITYQVFTPKKYQTTKTIIYLHGGGFVTGSIKSYSLTLYNLAQELKRNIITFNYPLAPEHPFPEGLNYCYEAVKLLFKKAKVFKIDTSDIVIMGDSAGANLATSICLKAKRTKEFKIKKEILLYPIVQTDFSSTTPFKSVKENGSNYYLTTKLIKDYLSLYITNSNDYQNPYVAPLYAKNLFGMPKTFIITADLDPLRDEGYAYAQKLRRYFNKVVYYNMKGVIHGFFSTSLYFLENYYITKKIKRFIGDKNV